MRSTRLDGRVQRAAGSGTSEAALQAASSLGLALTSSGAPGRGCQLGRGGPEWDTLGHTCRPETVGHAGAGRAEPMGDAGSWPAEWPAVQGPPCP